MASVHEAMTDLYEIGGIDAPTMARFDDLCLTDAASLGEQIDIDQEPTP